MTTIDKHPPGAVAWVDLMSSDPEASRQFYGQLFDWSFDMGPPESGPYTMARRGELNVAGIGPKPPDNPMPTAWTVYFATDDADATCAAVTEAGGRVVAGPMDVFEEGRLAIVTEPTGAVFGLWQPRRHPGTRLVAEPGAFAWTECNTRDLARTRTFMTTVFGYRHQKLEGMEYEILSLGDAQVGGVMQMTEQWPAEVPPHWMIYFQVTDTDATAARAAELGGKPCVPAFDTPYGRIAVLEDPQGGVFSVVQPPAA